MKTAFVRTPVLTALCLALLGGSAPGSILPALRPPHAVLQLDVQAETDKALDQALRARSPEPFVHLRQRLRLADASQARYWHGYVALHESIYYLQQNDRKRAEQVVENGLKQLQEPAPQRAEDYALLAHLQSFAIQFRHGMAAALAAAKVKSNAERALKLDARNLRAYYVLASNDFYTPARYGGGKKTEGYLLKALAQPDQSAAGAQGPSWGREQTYELLVRFYHREQKPALAQKYYAEARRRYPSSTTLAELGKALEQPAAAYN
ncbi:hypothetical protein [Hymenobacter edaphi]|uniref:Tetratricopeptide repeat protein n=1 Tax=Hymenobacter edaphi TaxID=2211146 RepID=A0A328BLQ9_9BACT|nr:hypothetical protein [Hymenobacter edaphi]RAK68043.1 hypothetical protein DLM85_08355 [Hymenobacter edaphi]